MSNGTTQNPSWQKAPILPVATQQINHLAELNQVRKNTHDVMKSLMPIISELRKENAELKAQLAEAQKKP